MENDSFGFVYYQSGELMLLGITGNASSDTMSLRLNTDSRPMTPSDGFGTYTEPTVPDYSPQDPFVHYGLSGLEWFADFDPQTFTLSVPTHTTITVYGWWYQDDTRSVNIYGGNLRAPITYTPGSYNLTLEEIRFGVAPCVQPPPPPPTLLIEDYFGDPSPTNLSAHIISPTNTAGVSYTTALGAGVECQGLNGAFGGNSSGEVISVTGSLGTDTLSLRALIALNDLGAQSGGIMCRASTGGDGLLVELNGGASGNLNLYAVHSGSFNFLGALTVGVNSGETYEVTLETDGTAVTYGVTGVGSATFGSTTFATNKGIGLHTSNASTARSVISDLRVTTP